jgi:hypothetical protein
MGDVNRFLRDADPDSMDDEEDIDYSDENLYTNDDEDEQYRRQAKQPMEAKQSLLHPAATEIIVNTRLHGELPCSRTTFESWYPLLPHQPIFAVLEFLGISKKWMKFMDEPSAEPSLRHHGMPGFHALIDILGETVLFCLSFVMNQATEGADLYRPGDVAWFWKKDYDKCASAWASTQVHGGYGSQAKPQRDSLGLYEAGLQEWAVRD